jgi:hypothetical protein
MLRRLILLLDVLQSALTWLRLRLQIAELSRALRSARVVGYIQDHAGITLVIAHPDPWTAWAEGEGAEVLEEFELWASRE